MNPWKISASVILLLATGSSLVGGFVVPPIQQPTTSTEKTTSSRLYFMTDKYRNDRDNGISLMPMERKVAFLTDQVKLEQRRATEARNQWMRERTQLVHKISVLTTLLKESTTQLQAQAQDNSEQQQQQQVEALELELSMSSENEEELLQEQERLEREVSLLQHQIVQIRNLYKTEQHITAELEQQLDTAQLEREDEQMEYQRMIEAQKRHIEALQSHIQNMELQKQQPPVPVSVSASNHRYSRNETMSSLAYSL